MILEVLLWDCLLPGRMADSEAGKGIVLSPASGTAVLVFRTDSAGYRNPFQLQNARVSDYAVLAFKAGSASLLFVELKSEDFDGAVEQIESTSRHFRQQLGGFWKRLQVKGIVVMTRRPAGKVEKKASERLGFDILPIQAHRGRRVDLTPHL